MTVKELFLSVGFENIILICGHADDVQGEIALRIIGISDLKPDEDE